MANRYHVELISEGVRELLKCSAISSACESQARAIASRAGSGYDVSVYTGKTRVNASVFTATEEAMRDNYQNNTLLKVVK